jgi:DNA-binding MarR family transcriptional regulator
MKKFYLIGIVLMLLMPAMWAQPGGGQDVESLKIAFITRRLSLTPDEAKVFWPVYDAYALEMKEVREGMRLERQAARRNFDEMSDKELDTVLENMLDFKRRELDITLKYHDQFKRVLPIRKVAQLYRAEQEFTRILLERLQERQENGGRPGGPGGGRPGGRF